MYIVVQYLLVLLALTRLDMTGLPNPGPNFIMVEKLSMVDRGREDVDGNNITVVLFQIVNAKFPDPSDNDTRGHGLVFLGGLREWLFFTWHCGKRISHMHKK